MNERIFELARQAGATFVKGYIELSDGQLMLSDGADVDHTTMDLKKFAELIMMECFKAAMIESRGHRNPSELLRCMKARIGVE